MKVILNIDSNEQVKLDLEVFPAKDDLIAVSETGNIYKVTQRVITKHLDNTVSYRLEVIQINK